VHNPCPRLYIAVTVVINTTGLYKDPIIFSEDKRQIVGKIPYLAMMKNPSKYSRIRTRRRRLSKFNQFFLVHRYIRGKIFTKIR